MRTVLFPVGHVHEYVAGKYGNVNHLSTVFPLMRLPDHWQKMINPSSAEFPSHTFFEIGARKDRVPVGTSFGESISWGKCWFRIYATLQSKQAPPLSLTFRVSAKNQLIIFLRERRSADALQQNRYGRRPMETRNEFRLVLGVGVIILRFPKEPVAHAIQHNSQQAVLGNDVDRLHAKLPIRVVGPDH